MKRVFLSMLFALTGCEGEEAIKGQIPPTNYMELVREHVRKSYFDPYSLRDAEISMPQGGRLFTQAGWIVCLQANAKNRFGAYVGLRRTAYLIKNGQIVNALQDAPLCNSPQLAYIPFKMEAS